MDSELQTKLNEATKAMSHLDRVNKKARTWERKYGVYHCGNCGKIPIYADIRDMGFCMYCMIGKTHYVTKAGQTMPLRNPKQNERYKTQWKWLSQ